MFFLSYGYHVMCFSGIYLLPCWLMLERSTASQEIKTLIRYGLLFLEIWLLLNNISDYLRRKKQLSDYQFMDGIFIDQKQDRKTAEYRKALWPKIPKELRSKKPEGIVLGKSQNNQYVRIPPEKIFHTAVLGGSGSGKSSTILLSTLLANFQAARQLYNVFAIDIKGELHEKSVRNDQKDVHILNPASFLSEGWNVYYRLSEDTEDSFLIEEMTNISQAIIVSTNTKDEFFVVNAQNLLIGLLIYYYQQGLGFIETVRKILSSDLSELTSQIVEKSAETDAHTGYLAKFAGKKSEAIENIQTELTTYLSVFLKPEIQHFFQDAEIKADPRQLNEGQSIFLAIPEYTLEMYRPILRLCVVQTLREMERRSESQKQTTLLIIDEFARIGKVAGIFNALATLRSKKVCILLAFQSISQCESIYSHEETRTLMENCRCKLILENSDPQSAKMIIGYAGTYRERKETQNTGKNRSKTISYEDKDILNQNDLMTLSKRDEAVLILAETGYLRLKKCFYFKDKQLKKLSENLNNTR